MNDRATEHGGLPPRPAANAGSPSKALRLNPLPLVTLCAAVAAMAALGWQSASAVPPSALLSPNIATGETGVASSAGENLDAATPVARASSVTSTPAARTAPEMPTAIAEQLNELKAAYERLVQQSQERDHRLDGIEAHVEELRQQLAKSHAAQAKAQRQARELTRQLRVAQATASQARTIQQQPTVLSVDTWNGRPSVSVQVGGEVRFFAEGDVVANALVRKADAATQRVEFVGVSGASVTTGASSRGEAR